MAFFSLHFLTGCYHGAKATIEEEEETEERASFLLPCKQAHHWTNIADCFFSSSANVCKDAFARRRSKPPPPLSANSRQDRIIEDLVHRRPATVETAPAPDRGKRQARSSIKLYSSLGETPPKRSLVYAPRKDDKIKPTSWERRFRTSPPFPPPPSIEPHKFKPKVPPPPPTHFSSLGWGSIYILHFLLWLRYTTSVKESSISWLRALLITLTCNASIALFRCATYNIGSQPARYCKYDCFFWALPIPAP